MNTQLTAGSIRTASIVASIVFAAISGRGVQHGDGVATSSVDRSIERIGSDSEALAMTGPANDVYSNAINMNPGHRVKKFDLVPATTGTEGQGSTACWSSGGVENDVWYVFEADETGTWTVSLCSSEDDFDSRLVVYEFVTGMPPSTQVACGDNECSNGRIGGHASTTFSAVTGQKFYIQVGGINITGAADGDLQLTSP